jgi:hypothetical protein
MSTLLAIALAAAIQPTCSWDRPGQNPYTGGTEAAIDRYTDIPAAVRGTLKRRMAEGQSDDQVEITRDAISGKRQYGAQIRDMHFGRASVCGTVTRAKWAADRVEPAAVYCVGEHCVLVPKICGNVSRITRGAPAVADANSTAGAAPATGVASAGDEAANPDGIQQFDDISLADAPLHDAPMELAPWEEGADADARRLLGDLDLLLNDEYGRNYAFGNHGHGHDGGDDEFIPAPVPEPETWAMLLGGLGLMAWMARRRAARAA